ncbi:MAG: GNAT family N-acetyltransferase [Anaerolineales bacterium]|nr:GNAT family N-acetyltransferase [Anaerolineales bacterium]
MEIVEIKKAEIAKIKVLWEELNAYHRERSTHFKAHFASFTFEKRIEKLQVKDQLVIYAAEIDSELVGYCIATVKGKIGEIDSLYIQKEYRGDNLGRKLTEKALSWLNKFECDEIYVYVAEGTEPVLPFYETLGFRERYRVLQIR